MYSNCPLKCNSSKAKRKKKREESEKLPEVSKEIYYDVAVDLKRMFGSTKPIAEKNEVTPWDKEDGVEESTVFDQQMLSNAEEESGGFTFSFFGVDMDKSAVKEGVARICEKQGFLGNYLNEPAV